MKAFNPLVTIPYRRIPHCICEPVARLSEVRIATAALKHRLDRE